MSEKTFSRQSDFVQYWGHPEHLAVRKFFLGMERQEAVLAPEAVDHLIAEGAYADDVREMRETILLSYLFRPEEQALVMIPATPESERMSRYNEHDSVAHFRWRMHMES